MRELFPPEFPQPLSPKEKERLLSIAKRVFEKAQTDEAWGTTPNKFRVMEKAALSLGLAKEDPTGKVVYTDNILLSLTELWAKYQKAKDADAVHGTSPTATIHQLPNKFLTGTLKVPSKPPVKPPTEVEPRYLDENGRHVDKDDGESGPAQKPLF